MSLSVSNSDSPNKRINSLQALRGIAFLGITSFHCGVSLMGPWSVTIFFVLSGFVLMYSKKPVDCTLKNSICFSLNKIKKLYPLYLITLAVYYIYRNRYSLRTVLLNVFLLQSWVPDSNTYYSMNGVAWFFSDMLFIYCFFPLIKRTIEKHNSRKMCFIAMIAAAVTVSAISITFKYLNLHVPRSDSFYNWIAYICPVTRLGDFIIGCNLGYIYTHSENNISKQKATVLEIIAIIMFFGIQAIYYLNAKAGISDHMPYLYLSDAVLVIYLFALKKGVFTNVCSNKLLIYIGNLSGLGFLIHRLTADMLYKYVFMLGISSHKINDIICFILSALITVVLAALYSKIQKDLLKKIKKKQ